LGSVWLEMCGLVVANTIRHERGALGGLVGANTFGETLVGTLQARRKPLKNFVVAS
jgi:hypothetical protein